MTLRLLVCLAALVPLVASAKEPKPRSYEIIIVGGGKTEAEAQAALERLKEKVLWVRLAATSNDLPGVKKSDDYPGLNKGLHIAVLGLCVKGGDTNVKDLLKAVKPHAPGVYSKSIKGQYGDPCPPVHTFTPPSDEEKPFLERIAKEPKSPEAYVAYGRFLQGQGSLHEAGLMADEALRLDPNHEDAKNLGHTINVLLMD
ncbi:MAG: hypothetical protein EOO71_17735 [Myxococcaceae bacterium]|nr:MAG: hypothetical protein EOO71_17735 [Myxococcaceae bacterium]